MKTFKQYLAEAVKEYTFKVKIAGVLEDSHLDAMELALAPYNVVKVGSPKKTIMQEHPLDFPANVTNTEVTIIEVTTAMPVSYQTLSRHLSDHMGLPYESVVVCHEGDPLQAEQDKLNAEKTDDAYEPIMGQDYKKEDSEDASSIVHSEDSKQSFLKGLAKAQKNEGGNVEVVTGLQESKVTSYIAKGKK
tara:strand:- start:1033 stop:1602 length:570 start_codon:yes stop_codon:yes gene_type:complete